MFDFLSSKISRKYSEMTWRKEKGQEIREKFNKRLIFVYPEDNIVFDVCKAILNSVELPTVDSHLDNRQYLLELLISWDSWSLKCWTLIQIIRWSLDSGPKMVWAKSKSEPNHTWIVFLRIMESKYSSEITHARIRSSLNSVSLSGKLK